MMKPFHVALVAVSVLVLPLWAHENEEQKLLPSDGAAGDQFGRSVAISGETILVGAALADAGFANSGAVYVFVHDHVLGFVEEAKLVPDDPAIGDQFGYSVAISGDTAIIGAPFADTAATDAGAAYVFVRSGTTWTQEAKLTGSTIGLGSAFGRSVAISGETTLVGAPATGTGVAGSAYVFVRSGGLWDEEDVLSASDGTTTNAFGWSVSLEGDRAIAGAMGANGQTTSSGAAYVYTRSGTLWNEEAKIAPADGATNDFFGISVALFNQNVAAIGASGDDDNGSNSGSAYVFMRSGTNWNQERKHSGDSPGDLMGGSVSFSHNTVLAGARFDDDDQTDQGSGLVFSNLSGTIGFQIFVASDAMVLDQLGTSVDIDGCEIVTGAVGDDTLGTNAGAAYIFGLVTPLVTLRNGSGVNPLCMATTVAPALGEDWEIEVDASAFPGAAFTQVIAHAKPLAVPVVTPWGEGLVNRSSFLYFSSTLPGSGVNTHVQPIPDDPFVAGYTIYIQGIIRNGSSQPIQLCNAEDVRIGCHHEE